MLPCISVVITEAALPIAGDTAVHSSAVVPTRYSTSEATNNWLPADASGVTHGKCSEATNPVFGIVLKLPGPPADALDPTLMAELESAPSATGAGAAVAAAPARPAGTSGGRPLFGKSSAFAHDWENPDFKPSGELDASTIGDVERDALAGGWHVGRDPHVRVAPLHDEHQTAKDEPSYWLHGPGQNP
jgi:hypothetical protein